MATPNKTNAKRVTVPLARDHESVTSDTTVALFKARKRTRIERVDYYSQVGLAEDATNAFAVSVKNGATVVADGVNTDSDGAGSNSLAAATFVTLTNGAAADRILAAGDVLSALLDESGTATLPAGTFVVWFTELS